MSSPALPARPDAVWSRFPLDPRSSGDLRAGDNDREIAREILAEAYTDGRLDRAEYDQRIENTLQARHLGQLVPMLNDISVPVPRQPQAAVKHAPGFLQHGPVKAAIFVVGVTNLTWLWVSIGSGGLRYYWPMWPMLGMVIMLLAVFLFQRSPQEREQHHRARELRRNQHHQDRQDRPDDRGNRRELD